MPDHVALADLDARTHVDVFDGGTPRTVRLSLSAGESIPAHTHPGTTLVLICLSGQLELSLDDEVYELHSGEVIRFSGDRSVSPTAVDESTAIIVFVSEEGDT